jgi:hypothetical protein
MRVVNEGTKTQMRTFHEEVIDRIGRFEMIAHADSHANPTCLRSLIRAIPAYGDRP